MALRRLLQLRIVYTLYLILLCLRASCEAFPGACSTHNPSAPSLSCQDFHVDQPLLRSQLNDRAAVTQRMLARDDTSSSSASTASRTATSTVSSTSSPTLTTTPYPFDTSLGNNFTQPSCPTFFGNFLSNATFKSCIPFSLLLQNSDAFFEASSSNVTLNPVLEESCQAPFQTCSSLLWSLAQQLLSSSNCAQDYSLGNPLVVQAYRGLLSYAPMYKAACLKADPTGKDTGNDYPYCYTSSLNSSSGADSMLYFLPLGLGLPGGTSISCSSCTQQTMAIYAGAAVDSNSPLNKEYLPAANMINAACGANFVNASTAVAKASTTNTTSGTTRSITLSKFLVSIMAAYVLAIVA